MTAAARTAAWLTFLVIALLRLHDLEVPAPGWSSGLANGPDAAAGLVMTVARVVAIGLGWYLVAATLLTVAMSIAGAGRHTSRRPRGLVPRAVDDLLRGVCGLTLVLGTTATPALAATADREATITMRRLDGDVGTPEERAAITMRRLEPAPAVDSAPADPTPPGTHVIAAGEHLWSVAESTLTAAWMTPPTDAQIDPYWRELIRRNRSRMADPANPDLVRPGDTLELPPVPGPDV